MQNLFELINAKRMQLGVNHNAKLVMVSPGFSLILKVACI
jgi:hypothetical protein